MMFDKIEPTGLQMNQTLKSLSNIDNISIRSSINLEKNKLSISFILVGALENYIFPEKSKQKRADELWKATSFELFLANSKKEEYYELNFTSSLAWNFYYLSTYRADVQEVKGLGKPKIEVFQEADVFKIIFELETEALLFDGFDIYNLTCILKNIQNERTFWSLTRASIIPDFHNKKSFFKFKNI